MYSEQLENLIDIAIEDGVLTDKERAILKRRAEAEGIDPDEFELVVDSRLLAQKNKQNDTLSQRAAEKRQQERYGEMRKCPSCGAPVEAMQLRCPQCGYEFRNVEANHVVLELQKKLDEIDAQRPMARGDSVVGLLAGTFVESLGLDNTVARKAQIIQTYPIPNTREDLLEMLSLCMTNGEYGSVNDSVSDQKLTQAWRAKTKQVIAKTKMLMPRDREAMAMVAEAEKILAEWSPNAKVAITFGLVFLGLGLLITLLVAIN